MLLRATGDIEMFERALQLQGLRTLASRRDFWGRQQIADLHATCARSPTRATSRRSTRRSPRRWRAARATALALLARAARGAAERRCGRRRWRSRRGRPRGARASRRASARALLRVLRAERARRPAAGRSRSCSSARSRAAATRARAGAATGASAGWPTSTSCCAWRARFEAQRGPRPARLRRSRRAPQRGRRDRARGAGRGRRARRRAADDDPRRQGARVPGRVRRRPRPQAAQPRRPPARRRRARRPAPAAARQGEGVEDARLRASCAPSARRAKREEEDRVLYVGDDARPRAAAAQRRRRLRALAEEQAGRRRSPGSAPALCPQLPELGQAGGRACTAVAGGTAARRGPGDAQRRRPRYGRSCAPPRSRRRRAGGRRGAARRAAAARSRHRGRAGGARRALAAGAAADAQLHLAEPARALRLPLLPGTRAAACPRSRRRRRGPRGEGLEARARGTLVHRAAGDASTSRARRAAAERIAARARASSASSAGAGEREEIAALIAAARCASPLARADRRGAAAPARAPVRLQPRRRDAPLVTRRDRPARARRRTARPWSSTTRATGSARSRSRGAGARATTRVQRLLYALAVLREGALVRRGRALVPRAPARAGAWRATRWPSERRSRRELAERLARDWAEPFAVSRQAPPRPLPDLPRARGHVLLERGGDDARGPAASRAVRAAEARRGRQ